MSPDVQEALQIFASIVFAYAIHRYYTRSMDRLINEVKRRRK